MGKQFDENEKQFRDWLKEREAEIFQTEKFKAMGKGDNYVFQALVFAGNGSRELSISATILSELNEVPDDLKAELKSIQIQLHDFQEKLRTILYA